MWRKKYKFKPKYKKPKQEKPLDVKQKWRRIWAGYGLAMFVIGCVYLSGLEYAERNTPPPRPDVKVELMANAHDFGRVKQGDLLRHAFVVRNAGSKELVLRRHTRGRRKQDEPIRIRPNGFTEVVVTMNTANRWSRTRRQEVYITNDPEQKVLRLTVTAMVGY